MIFLPTASYTSVTKCWLTALELASATGSTEFTFAQLQPYLQRAQELYPFSKQDERKHVYTSIAYTDLELHNLVDGTVYRKDQLEQLSIQIEIKINRVKEMQKQACKRYKAKKALELFLSSK